ncbi:MAG: hypothetical protein FWH47_06290 [Methanomassiliicoccaceae archaeon]|nr:hypothetical protein [Methanomassiliicoccaceae archaeon]
MELKNKMKTDRSGISTILIAVVVIVVIAVAAAAAYVVLTGNDEGEKEIIAPGTVLEYDLLAFDMPLGTMEVEYIGQSADLYFIKITQSVQGIGETSAYSVDPKGVPDGAKKTGTAQIDTILGKKTADVWELTERGVTVKTYVDQSNLVLTYRQEWTEGGMPLSIELTKYEPKWQTSYEESEDIGTEYTYVISYGGYSYDRKMICIADCLGGKYGVSYDLSNFREGDDDLGILYFLSNYPEGLPSDATKVGGIISIGTLNYGNKQVEKWSMSIAGVLDASFYCDPTTHVVYRAVFDETGTPITFDLE